jgi:tetratricopeptide (TPR) repeat protein
MAKDDWFRNANWNDAIEGAFFEKLQRAKSKAQYLRIQACILAEKHPKVALRLLDQYFTLGDHFDDAQAHVDRASAYLSLGQTELAIKSYEEALAVEDIRPNAKTSAYILLPFLIATYGIEYRYGQAIELLNRHHDRPGFPVEHFRWHASRALIASELGDTAAARIHAQRALEEAARDRSGLRYHGNIGLVGDNLEKLRERLAALS